MEWENFRRSSWSRMVSGCDEGGREGAGVVWGGVGLSWIGGNEWMIGWLDE